MSDNSEQKYIYGETFSPEAPRPTAVAYEILAENLSKGGNDVESHTALNDIYKALASSEQSVVIALDKLEQKNIISREDALMLTVLLAVSRTLGPNWDFLRRAVITGNFNPNEINISLANSGLDQRITGYLQKVVVKFKI